MMKQVELIASKCYHPSGIITITLMFQVELFLFLLFHSLINVAWGWFRRKLFTSQLRKGEKKIRCWTLNFPMYQQREGDISYTLILMVLMGGSNCERLQYGKL